MPQCYKYHTNIADTGLQRNDECSCGT